MFTQETKHSLKLFFKEFSARYNNHFVLIYVFIFFIGIGSESKTNSFDSGDFPKYIDYILYPDRWTLYK
jgi:hypothetical protein